jgi:hypothetical protein
MITKEHATKLVIEWLQDAERKMNSFGSALPGYSEKEHLHLIIVEPETEEHDFGWVFYWTSREYIETGEVRYALGGNAPLIVDRRDGGIHPTGTARMTAERSRILVTDRAYARSAPSIRLAHLGR